VMDHAAEVMDQALDSLSLYGILPEDEEGFSIDALVKLVWAWQWLHRHDWSTEWDLFIMHMQEPTHAMDMYGKLAENLAETQFYQERDFRNPFKAKKLSVTDVMQLAQRATDRMGEWQDDDCKVMKKKLIRLDPERDGRVPLSILYDQPMEADATGEQIFRFAEDQDYLRTIGALDESIPDHPQVMISNYILGPANCFRSTALHTFCCLNECDAVLSKVERAVKGSSAKPADLAPLLANLTTPSMDEPREFPEELMQKLFAIAAKHRGRVPLHGRLFAQWLHFAFPHECPYPHVTQKDEAGNALMTSYFQGAAGDSVGWTDDEMLPLGEVDPLTFIGFRHVLGAVFMVLALGAMSLQVSRMAKARMRNFRKDFAGVDHLDKCV